MKNQPQPPTADELERQVREFDLALHLFTGRNFHVPAVLKQQQEKKELTDRVFDALQSTGIIPK